MDRRKQQRAGGDHARWWADRAWPVLAGGTGAVGIFGAAHGFGVGAMVSAWLALTVLILGTMLGVTADGRFTLGRVLRSSSAACGVVALAGLASLFDGYGLALAAPAVLTSPPVAGAASRLAARSRRRTPPVHDMLADPHAVDTAFEEIVAGLEEPERHPDE